MDHGPPIRNGLLGFESLKGQGRDSNMLKAQYLENGWRYRLNGSNGPPIGNGLFGFEWSRD